MGIKRKIKHAIKKRKEREVAFEVDGHPVIKREDYICNSDEEGYGLTRYVKCSKKNRIKTTIYVTTTLLEVYADMKLKYIVYAFPVISKKKWAFYIHERGEGIAGDYDSVKNYNELFNTPKEAIKKALRVIANLPYT